MNLNQFYKFILGFSALSLVVLGVLAWIGENQRPSVTHLEILGEVDTAEYIRQEIALTFSRPMNWEDISSKVTIEPEVDFLLFTNSNQLVFTPSDLEPGTDYKLTVSTDLHDIYDKSLLYDYTLSFTTETQKYSYLSRSADQDVIYLAGLEGEPEQIYSASRINDYLIAKDWVIVNSITKDSQEDFLAQHRESNEVIQIESGSVRVTQMAYSKPLNVLVYTVQPVEVIASDTEGDAIVAPQDVHTLKRVDLDTGRISEMRLPVTFTDYLDVRFTGDGLGLIARDADGVYYLFDYSDLENNLSLGRHISLSKFSPDGDEVVIMDQNLLGEVSIFPIVTLLNNKQETTQLLDGSKFAIDFEFVPNSEDLIYAGLSKELQASKGVFELRLINKISGESRLLYKDSAKQQRSIELPRISPSGKLILAERYTQEQITNFEGQRNIEFQTKPFSGDLLLLDLSTGEVLKEIENAIEADWVN